MIFLDLSNVRHVIVNCRNISYAAFSCLMVFEDGSNVEFHTPLWNELNINLLGFSDGKKVFNGKSMETLFFFSFVSMQQNRQDIWLGFDQPPALTQIGRVCIFFYWQCSTENCKLLSSILCSVSCRKLSLFRTS